MTTQRTPTPRLMLGLALLGMLVACSSGRTTESTSVATARAMAPVAAGSAVRVPTAASSSFAQAAPAPGAAANGGTMPIDLPSALRLASSQNLDVRGLKEHLRQKHFEMVHAGQWWFPTIRAGTTFNAVSGDVQGTNGNIVDVDKTNALVGGDVILDWEVGDGIFGHLAASKRSRAASADTQAGNNDALARAAVGYFELLKAQSALQVAQSAVDLYTTFTAETEAAVEAGKGFRGDFLSAKARLAHARVRRDGFKGRVRIAAARLRETLNLPSTVELRAVEPQPVPLELITAGRGSEQVLIQEALRGRPEIRAANMRSQAKRAEHNQATAGPFYPDVRIGWRGGAFGDDYDDFDGTSHTAIGLNWKLGRNGIGDASRASAMAARARRARVNVMSVRQQVVREVTSAVAAMDAQSSAIAAADQGVKDAEEALSLYQERSKLGVNEPLEAIVFEGVLTQARLDYVDAVVDYNQAQVRLLRALGRAPVP